MLLLHLLLHVIASTHLELIHRIHLCLTLTSLHLKIILLLKEVVSRGFLLLQLLLQLHLVLLLWLLLLILHLVVCLLPWSIVHQPRVSVVLLCIVLFLSGVGHDEIIGLSTILHHGLIRIIDTPTSHIHLTHILLIIDGTGTVIKGHVHTIATANSSLHFIAKLVLVSLRLLLLLLLLKHHIVIRLHSSSAHHHLLLLLHPCTTLHHHLSTALAHIIVLRTTTIPTTHSLLLLLVSIPLNIVVATLHWRHI